MFAKCTDKSLNGVTGWKALRANAMRTKEGEAWAEEGLRQAPAYAPPRGNTKAKEGPAAVVLNGQLLQRVKDTPREEMAEGWALGGAVHH